MAQKGNLMRNENRALVAFSLLKIVPFALCLVLMQESTVM